MKKFLLAFSSMLVGFSALADVTAFVAADGTEFYKGDGKVIVIPEGFYFITPADREPNKMIEKSIVSDLVMISGANTSDKVNNVYVTSGGLRWYDNAPLVFTPAEGVTIETIKVLSQSTSYNGTIGKDPVVNGTLQTLTVNSSKADTIFAAKQNRAFYIEITTSGTSKQVALPVSSLKFPAVESGSELALTCATAGAKIYYTLDGSVPTTASTLYSAPVKVTEDVILRAIAVKDGMTSSFPIYEEYYVVAPKTTMATFDFSDFTTLEKADGTKYTITDLPAEKANKNFSINDVELVNNGVSFVATGGANNRIFRSWTFGNVVEFRPVNPATMTITAPKDMVIANIYIQGSKIVNTVLAEGQTGTLTVSPVNASRSMYVAADEATAEVKLATKAADEYIDQIYVFFKSKNTGVESIVAEDDSVVEYYNIGGLKVDANNLVPGIYVKKQGKQVSKIVIR